MEFILTEERHDYLNSRGKTILNACPGSGKTTSIAYKLNTIDVEIKETKKANVGFACLSFTNVAKDEINSRFRRFTEKNITFPSIVKTIDSFINCYITLPYFHLLNPNVKRPIILENQDFLNSVKLSSFWTKTKAGVNMGFSYPPSTISVNINKIYLSDYRRPDSSRVDFHVFDTYCKSYMKWKFDKGYLTNEDSTYYALCLLNRYPRISKYLAIRFPYIIIDEAQDTSETQYAIFDKLLDSGLENFELIGDPYQSLYQFRSARPDLFLSRCDDTKNWKSLTFSECIRSTQNIIDVYQKLRSAKAKPIRSISGINPELPVCVLTYDKDNPDDLISSFKALTTSGEANCIVVRGETHLEMFGIKSSDHSPWKEATPRYIVEAIRELKRLKVKNAIDIIRNAVVKLQCGSDDPKIIKKAIEDHSGDYLNAITLMKFLKTAPQLSLTLADWTEQCTALLNDTFKVSLNFGLKQGIWRKHHSLTIDTIFPIPSNTDIEVTTIHKVKGKTFDSIMIVLNDNSSGESISLNNLQTANDKLGEKERMLYVALSRPKKLACIATPPNFNKDKILEILGNQVNVI